MTLPDRWHISWQNDIADFTLTASPVAETAYPITNAQNKNSNEPAVLDVNAVTAASITASGSAQLTATCFSLHNHNMPTDNGARLRLYENASQAGKLLKDTGSSSVAFDGSTQYATIPDSAENSLVGTIFTFYARIKPDDSSPASAEYFFSKWTTAGNQRGWSFRINSDSTISIIISEDGTGTGGTGTSDNAASWSATDPITVKAEYNSTTGLTNFWEYTETTEGYLPSIDGADFDYLDSNSLWDSIGTGDDTGTTGGPVDVSAVVMAGGLDGAASFDGDFVRAAAYVDGSIIADADIRRHITGSTLTTENAETATLVGSPTVTPVYDSVAHTIPFGSIISGIDPLGGSFEAEGNLKAHYSTWFDSVVYRSLRIDLDLPTSTNDTLSIDKIWLGFAWSPTYGPEYGHQSTIVDPSEHQRKPGGGLETVEDYSYKIQLLKFRGHASSERHVLRSILDRAKKGGDLLCTMDPYNNLSLNYEMTSIFRRTNNASFTAQYYNGHALGLSLEEN